MCLCSFSLTRIMTFKESSQLSSSSNGFDPSQFTLQPDGTFRISIRATAQSAGVDHSGIVRALASAGDESPLPLARSLAAQGFSPGDVMRWGQAGVPEVGYVAILKHYGFAATSPSRKASDTLLSFASVGVNAFLRDILGVSQVRDTQVPALPAESQKLEWMMGFCQKWDISLDSRDMLHIKEYAKSLALPPAGGTQSVFNDYPISRLVQNLFGVVLKNSQLQAIGKSMAKLWRFEMNKEPQKHDQYVDGAVRSVAHYPRDWAEAKLRELHAKKPEMFQRN